MVRSECENGVRPCPYLSCRHHLASEVSGNGNVHYSFLLELFEGEEESEIEMRETCALDVADRGPARLEEIASILGVSRERIRQIEARAMKKMEHARVLREWGRPD